MLSVVVLVKSLLASSRFEVDRALPWIVLLPAVRTSCQILTTVVRSSVGPVHILNPSITTVSMMRYVQPLSESFLEFDLVDDSGLGLNSYDRISDRRL